MPDREKVIKRLGKVSYYFKSLLAVGWQGDADTYREHMESVNMALELLKEQEPQSVIVKCEPSNGNILWFANCPKCGQGIERDKHKNYCGYCGQAVKWE